MKCYVCVCVASNQNTVQPATGSEATGRDAACTGARPV